MRCQHRLNSAKTPLRSYFAAVTQTPLAPLADSFGPPQRTGKSVCFKRPPARPNNNAKNVFSGAEAEHNKATTYTLLAVTHNSHGDPPAPAANATRTMASSCPHWPYSYLTAL